MKQKILLCLMGVLLIVCSVVSCNLIVNKSKCVEAKNGEYLYLYLTSNTFPSEGKLLTVINKNFDAFNNIIKTASKTEESYDLTFSNFVLRFMDKEYYLHLNSEKTIIIEKEQSVKVLDEENTLKLKKLLGLNNLIKTCEYTKTYYVSNIYDSHDEKYQYITLSWFTGEEVSTVKVLRNSIYKTGKNYEFTFKQKYNVELLSTRDIFEYADLIEVVETDKTGMEQKNGICAP